MEKPKLLLDENIGTLVAKTLRVQGYDVVSILEEEPGMSDSDVLNRAFGRLIYLYSQRHAGVILLRLKDESSQNINYILSKILTDYGSRLIKKFITVSETKVRLR